MHAYCIYLRKSRSDMQLEQRSGGDVLDRHYRTLTELAARLGITVSEVYREVASGDSIAGRPEMLRLLDDVQAGRWAGVLCMDIDRLGRGDTADQAVILTNFMYSGTQIITPAKTYDLTNDADEDQSEFKLMFSRMEYKTIKRRLYAGRERSARDGWYLGAKHPFGYRKIKTTGPTLEIVPEQAEIVTMIFTWYAAGDGKNTICDRLNAMGSRTNSGVLWGPSSVWAIITNPLYIGMVRWGRRVGKAVYIDGQKVVKRPINPDMIVVPGRHPAIISQELWEAVQARLQGNSAPSIKDGQTVTNPLCGLVRCARCGKTMQRHFSNSSGKSHELVELLRCPNRHCDQYSIRLPVLEGVILGELKALTISPAELPEEQKQRAEARKATADGIRKKINEAEAQQAAAFDFLERGVYTLEEFATRRETLSNRLIELHSALEKYDTPDADEARVAAMQRVAPRARSVLEAYSRAGTPQSRNELLKTVIDHIEYNRTERSYRATDPTAGLEITLFPLLDI